MPKKGKIKLSHKLTLNLLVKASVAKIVGSLLPLLWSATTGAVGESEPTFSLGVEPCL